MFLRFSFFFQNNRNERLNHFKPGVQTSPSVGWWMSHFDFHVHDCTSMYTIFCDREPENTYFRLLKGIIIEFYLSEFFLTIVLNGLKSNSNLWEISLCDIPWRLHDVSKINFTFNTIYSIIDVTETCSKNVLVFRWKFLDILTFIKWMSKKNPEKWFFYS